MAAFGPLIDLEVFLKRSLIRSWKRRSRQAKRPMAGESPLSMMQADPTFAAARALRSCRPGPAERAWPVFGAAGRDSLCSPPAGARSGITPADVADRTLAGWVAREAAGGRIYTCGSEGTSRISFPHPDALHRGGRRLSTRSSRHWRWQRKTSHSPPRCSVPPGWWAKSRVPSPCVPGTAAEPDRQLVERSDQRQWAAARTRRSFRQSRAAATCSRRRDRHRDPVRSGRHRLSGPHHRGLRRQPSRDRCGAACRIGHRTRAAFRARQAIAGRDRGGAARL